ncbi:MAG: hypothetical protein ABI577_03560 [bacterium]
MRIQAYRLFEIVAWPAAVWCGIELALRVSTASFEGISMTAITGACALLTIAGTRIRTRQLATQRASR